MVWIWVFCAVCTFHWQSIVIFASTEVHPQWIEAYFHPATVPSSNGVSRKTVQRSFGCLSERSGCWTLGPIRLECSEERDFTKNTFQPLSFLNYHGNFCQRLLWYILSYTNIFTKSMASHYFFKLLGRFKAVWKEKMRKHYWQDLTIFFYY